MPEHMRYSDARPMFERADLLLCKGTNFWSSGIRIASLSPYSHAGMLAFRNDVPVVLDVLQWRGGSSRPLEHEVIANPGVWDFYKANAKLRWPEFDRYKAHNRMWEFDACGYGWWELSKASLIYLPVVRLFQKVESLRIDDEKSLTTPPHCAMAYSIACEGGGVDPVANLKHSMTTPGHLSMSVFFEKICTLWPDDEDVSGLNAA